MRIGVYPGTFDPITNGHIDIIRRASKMMDKLIVGAARNPGKGPMFSLDERTEMVRDELEAIHQDNRRTGHHCEIEVTSFGNLLMHFAEENNARFIIRGLRAVSDFDYEFQMASMNAKMAPDVETVCLMASDKYQFIASSLVKEIAKLKGDVSQFVSPRITERLIERLGG